MRIIGSAVVLAMLVTVTGCSASSSTSSPPSGSAPSGSTTSASAASTPTATSKISGSGAQTPKALYQRMRAEVIKASSGAFSQRDVTDLGDGIVTVTMDGSYDLTARTSQMQESWQTKSPTFLKTTPNPATLTTNFRDIGPNGYQSKPAWPAALRGRWLQTTSAKTVGQAASLSGGPKAASPETLAALLALTPTSVKPGATGWTLSGRVRAPYAALALGLGKELRKKSVNVTTMKGSAKITVEVAANGLPSQVRIDGSTLTVTSPLPAGFSAIFPRVQATLDLLEFGQRVKISAPTGHELISPSEMPS